jgi:hypothetical protein
MRLNPFATRETERPLIHLPEANIAMTRDQLNRELRAHSATFPAVLIVYAVILGTMILTGMAMT